MPGRLFQVSISARFSGLSSGKLPRIAKRFGYLAAASFEILPEFGSQPGGCSRQASTPAASMSRMHSTAVYEVTWRCDGLVGGPADQMWTWASTINMASSRLVSLRDRHATRCRSLWDSLSQDPAQAYLGGRHAGYADRRMGTAAGSARISGSRAERRGGVAP